MTGGREPDGRGSRDGSRGFDPAEPGTLAEQRPLEDAEGDDIREYTGEPVETEAGWVLPQQQNVGPGNQATGGATEDEDEVPKPPRDDDQLDLGRGAD